MPSKIQPSNRCDTINAPGLLVLRFFLDVFLLQWSIEKLILPGCAVRISQSSKYVALPETVPYVCWVAPFLMRYSDVYAVDGWRGRARLPA